MLKLDLVETVIKDGIAIIPTDTVLGLVCNGFSQEATQRVFHIKNRPRTKPLAIFVPNLDWIVENCITDEKIMQFLQTNLPGAFTVILNLKSKTFANKFSNIGIGDDLKIGIRIPNNKLCIEISQMILDRGGIVCATSVNISGEESAVSYDMINKNILKSVDYIYYKTDDINFENGHLLTGVASTVVDLTLSTFAILRE